METKAEGSSCYIRAALFAWLISDICPGLCWMWEKGLQSPHVSEFLWSICKWAVTQQKQHNECAPSEDSDQPGHPLSLIRVFTLHSMGSKGPKLSSCRQRRLWSDWVDAQADLSLRWAQTHFVGFVMSRLTCLLAKNLSVNLRDTHF